MAVYVFGEPGALLVKVGFTNRWEEREKDLRRKFGGEMLYIEYTGVELAERLAHRFLRSRFWLDGEWFVCGAAVAKSAVRRSVRVIEERKREARRKSASRRVLSPLRVRQINNLAWREKRPLTSEEMKEIRVVWAQHCEAVDQNRSSAEAA